MEPGNAPPGGWLPSWHPAQRGENTVCWICVSVTAGAAAFATDTVRSPELPELITEGDTVEEALANAEDALAAVVEAYQDLGQPLPPFLRRSPKRCATSA